MTREQFMTRAWNNRLTALLGVPTAVWAVIALATPLLSDFSAHIGLMVLAAVY